MRRSLRARLSHAVGLAILSFVTIFPLYTVVVSSLKPLGDVRGEFHWIPTTLTLQPYVDIWKTIPLAHYFVNSLIVAVSATVCSVTLAIFAAYAISRYRFRGRTLFNITVLSTQMFPGILFLLPLFVIFVNIERSFGITLYGTYLGLIITYLTFSLPFSIWMLVGYFNSIPRELEEAAMTEGATPLQALFKILIPVSMPGIAAVAIYAFITAWGEVLFASVLTTDDTRTLAIGLRNYSSQTNVYWNQLMAAAIVVSAPVVLAFLAAQKWIVRGLTAGGVK
ncbi:MAG TPA: carbohydrate ABC transporter permease [Solirubrobacteraceae bacterium]|nr:carbohydrate ABC transporter permease [Solirubrobacteraceae bacterium]